MLPKREREGITRDQMTPDNINETVVKNNVNEAMVDRRFRQVILIKTPQGRKIFRTDDSKKMKIICDALRGWVLKT